MNWSRQRPGGELPIPGYDGLDVPGVLEKLRHMHCSEPLP